MNVTDPFDERTFPSTSRRRELADRVGALWLYYGGDVIRAVAIVLIAGAVVFVSTSVYGAPVTDDAAQVAVEADRVVVDHPGPPWAVLEGCDLAEWHAAAAGLPAGLFRAIADAESGCRNDITNRYGRVCCHGAWQIHQLWLADPRVRACGATDVASLRTDSPVSWAVNACAAAVILDEQGLSAWQVCTRRIVRCW